VTTASPWAIRLPLRTTRALATIRAPHRRDRRPRPGRDSPRDWGLGTDDRDRETALAYALTLVFDTIGARP
jgi:hypothetical protein